MPYIQGQLVFAKVRGHSPWPARIIRQVSKSSYQVFFYGTNQEAPVNEDNIWPYKDNRFKFSDQYGSKKSYKIALDLIKQENSTMEVEEMGDPEPNQENTLDQPAHVYKKGPTAKKRETNKLAKSKNPAKFKTKLRTPWQLRSKKVNVPGGRGGGVKVSNGADVMQVPGAGAVQVPHAVQDPGATAVQVPDAGAVQAPGAVQVPVAGAVQVPHAGAVQVPVAGAVQVPVAGAGDGMGDGMQEREAGLQRQPNVSGSGGREDKMKMHFKMEATIELTLDQFLTVGRELPGLVSRSDVRFPSQ